MVMVDTHSLVLDTTIQATSIMDTDPLTIHTMVMVDTHSLVLDTIIQATSIMDTDPLTIHTMDMDPLTMDMEDTDPVMDTDASSETRRTEQNYENGFLNLLQLPTFDSFNFNINLVKLW